MREWTRLWRMHIRFLGREARRTVGELGKEDALRYISYFDLLLSMDCPLSEDRLLAVRYASLLRDIWRFGLLFLGGMYETSLGLLRWMWEATAQAYYLDSKYETCSPDEKLEILSQEEQKMYGWRVVEEVLKCIGLLDRKEYFERTWRRLNKAAHPSHISFVEKLRAGGKPFLLDVYVEELARQTLHHADVAFDAMWAIFLKSCPQAREGLQEGWRLEFVRSHHPVTWSLISGIEG